LDTKKLDYFKGLQSYELEALKACTSKSLLAAGFTYLDLNVIDVLSQGIMMLLKTMDDEN
jgi:hypothetical protein